MGRTSGSACPETLEIYAPIANRLGLTASTASWMICPSSYLYPTRFRVLSKAVEQARGNRREIVERVRAVIQQKLDEAGIEASVSGREKHLFSIYKKMQEKSLAFSEVFDIYGFRIIVSDVPACYLALGARTPCTSLSPAVSRTTSPSPRPMAISPCIRCCSGRTAFPWRCRSEPARCTSWPMRASPRTGSTSPTRLSTRHSRRPTSGCNALLEIQADAADAPEFLEHVKVDLFPDEVYVFTPKGRIMALPRGATAVDFAYAVHTDVGNHCVAVRLNGELMPLKTELRNGDQVEIITAHNARPNPAWVHFAVTGKARAHIRQLSQVRPSQRGRSHG